MVQDELKVFISWSGQPAKDVANSLKELLSVASDRFAVWVSDDDIQSGQRSLHQIESQLAETDVGIIVVTPDNQERPWLHFEAGALSKQIGAGSKGRVIPLLVGMKVPELQPGPLTQFQARLCNVNDIQKIVIELAKLAEANETSVVKRIDGVIAEMVDEVTQMMVSRPRQPTTVARRDNADLLQEILTLTRDIYRIQKASDLVLDGRREPKSQYRGTAREGDRSAGSFVEDIARDLGLHISHMSTRDGAHGLRRMTITLRDEAPDDRVELFRTQVESTFPDATVSVKTGASKVRDKPQT